jgi:predicted PurR-regulated permease PerM
MASSGRKSPPLFAIVAFVLTVACMYWARAVLIPIALAVLLTFLLNPPVNELQHRGVPRIAAVILLVVLVFSLIGGVGWVLSRQLTILANELPSYTDNLKHKIEDLRGIGHGGLVEKVQRMIDELTGAVKQPAPAPTRIQPQGDGEKPVPVVIQSPSVLWQLPSLLESLATAGLVIVLVIFMLIKYADLRNRLIRLVGYARLTLTTRVLDEVGQRISRYLLMQSIINGSFGTAIGVGLFLIGLPYALLWGFLAAVLRFIPYIGTPVATILPTALSLAVFPGWVEPLLVLALFLPLELVTNGVIEPFLYGQSAGVSEVALMIAIIFWTWLWGPLGLLLATPLTVCLGVLGKHVPQLEFMGVILGDEPALDPHTSYYQRLLARDEDEAMGIVETYLKTHAPEALYDEVLIPALVAAKRDRELGALAAEDMPFILQATRAIVEDLDAPPRPGAATAPVEPGLSPTVAAPAVPILGCPAQDEADELALLLFQRVLDPARFALEMLSTEVLTAEVVALVEAKHLQLICIAALPPEALAPTRYLCKRLRACCADLKIVVGRWGATGDIDEQRDLLLGAGADEVGTTLRDTRDHIMRLSQLVSTPAPQSSPPPAPQG